MNVPALLISMGFGAAFFAAELKWQYRPVLIDPEAVISAFSTDHMKARAAVRRVLLDPDSAQFNALRSVAADAASYVCGAVTARAKNGKLADAAFVYAVSVDFARIDDDDQITRQHTSFRPCPSTDDDKKDKPDFAISPGTMAMVRAVQKIAPKGDTSVLSTLSSLAPSAGGPSAGGTMEQQIRQLAARTALPTDQTGGEQVTRGEQVNSTVKAGLANSSDWRADQPPLAWPSFPPDHPLAKPPRKRTPAEALALAKDVEDRWQRSETTRDAAMRPSPDEINEACRSLLAIDPRDADYRKAWAAFVRLQKIDRASRHGIDLSRGDPAP